MPTAEEIRVPMWWTNRVADEIGDDLPLWRRHMIAAELWRAFIDHTYFAVLPPRAS